MAGALETIFGAIICLEWIAVVIVVVMLVSRSSGGGRRRWYSTNSKRVEYYVFPEQNPIVATVNDHSCHESHRKFLRLFLAIRR